MFDALFRAHLSNVYVHLDEAPPPELLMPVAGHFRSAPWSEPKGTLSITIDGRATSLEEWLPAGHYSVRHEASAMRRSGETPIAELFFGFGSDSFCFRLDGVIWRSERIDDVRVILHLPEPVGAHLETRALHTTAPPARLSDHHGRVQEEAGLVAVDEVFECTCPFALLAELPGDRLEFFVEVLRGESLAQRLPQEGTIAISVPSNS